MAWKPKTLKEERKYGYINSYREERLACIKATLHRRYGDTMQIVDAVEELNWSDTKTSQWLRTYCRKGPDGRFLVDTVAEAIVEHL